VADRKCIDCGTTTADVLASVWAERGHAFDPPIGMACVDCRPEAFDAFTRDYLKGLEQ
jgi:hypothetical protein